MPARRQAPPPAPTAGVARPRSALMRPPPTPVEDLESSDSDEEDEEDEGTKT